MARSISGSQPNRASFSITADITEGSETHKWAPSEGGCRKIPGRASQGMECSIWWCPWIVDFRYSLNSSIKDNILKMLFCTNVCGVFFKRKKEINLIPKYLMQIKYVKALELKLEVCIWVTSWPIDSKLSVLVQRLSDCPNTCGPLWRKCAIFVCANHGGLSWIWTELESLRLFSFFFFLSPPFHFSTFQLLWMAFNTSLQPQRHLLEQRNSSEWIRTSILNILPACVLLSPSPLLLPPSPPSPPILLFFSFCPTLCSVCVGVEPLYRDGVLGRASKAFITAFAVLCYTGKHRATHAWPLTSLWSSAIHEKRGLWPTNLFLI